MKNTEAYFVCYVLSIFHVVSATNQLILISFDGFRHDYLQKTKLPNIEGIADNGVKAPYIVSTFTTKTLVNHFTSVTGVSAETHGIMNNVFYDKTLKRDLSAKDALFWQWGIGTITPIWSANEAIPGKYSGSSMWPGSTFVDRPTYDIPFNLSIPWKDRIDTALKWIVNEEKPAAFVSLYFEEPDMTAHLYGPDSKEVVDMLHTVDNTTGYILQRLTEMNLIDDFNVIITSDHGFTSVNSEKMINISAIVSTDSCTFHGDTPVMHVLPKEGLEEYVYNRFKKASASQNFTVYLNTELPKEWGYSNPDRTLPIVLVADEGYVFDDFDKTMDWMESAYNRTKSPKTTYGNHGYDPRLSSMHPFFVAQGPQFKSNFIGKPFHIVDMYEMMCRLLGISEVPFNEGKLERVEEYLLISHSIPWYEDSILIGFGVLVALAFIASVFLLLWISCSVKRSKVTIRVKSPSPRRKVPDDTKERWETEGLLYFNKFEEV
ncbi:bis(5'-adenosyl)-triphosphatase ENPP4-like [Artemia franciscana]|uniref:Uncharacterized protein n=1 Tax=Artemia franciscana TaxID=6661 RepID=A0AA88I0I6_ARTSF|nr:hypothetical protein QYM36_010430 [Artemia franciscana]